MTELVSAISLGSVTSENIAFGIAPHINAAGRMASADEAVKLFRSSDDTVIKTQVEKLVDFNRRRRNEQETAYNEASRMITGDEDIILLEMENIHEGIGGIVAGKIKENYYRPVIIVTPSGDDCVKGTGRSIPRIDIYRLLKQHDEFFERFGGHSSACGFLMKRELFDDFKALLRRDVAAMKVSNPDLFAKENVWELEIYPEEITVDLAKKLELMEPFGQGNPRPMFMIKNIVPESVRFMGADETHVRFYASGGSGISVGMRQSAECILFRKAQEKKHLICSGRPVDLTGTINIKEWRGRESVQFVIEEIR